MSGDLPGGGQDKRPRVTLELKAEEIRTGGEPQAAIPHVSQQAPQDSAAGGEEGSATPIPPRSNIASRASLAALVTHMVAGLTGGLIALVIGFVAVAEFGSKLTGADPSALNALRQRVSALEKAAPAAAGDFASAADAKRANDQLAALTARLTRAEQRIASVSATPGAPVPAAAPPPSPEIDFKPLLEPVEARVTALEAKVAGVAKVQASDRQSAATTALAVGINNLRRAVISGKPYTAEFGVVQKLGASEAELAALAAARETGLATQETLAQTLTPLVREASRTASGEADSGMMSKLWSEARSIVHIRRTGLVEGDSTDAILARMEVRVKAGDIAAAVKEGKALKGEAAVIMRPWMAQAEARAGADAALDRFEAKLLVALKSEGAKP
jgi:hypothetical protein